MAATRKQSALTSAANAVRDLHAAIAQNGSDHPTTNTAHAAAQQAVEIAQQQGVTLSEIGAAT